MKLYVVITMGFCCMLFAGCSEMEQNQNRHLINSGLINTYKDTSVQNAIISQHTLYPYHFVNNSAELNELGLRDIAVLSAHFDRNPGQLNIRHGNVSTDLYVDRIDFVLDKLKKAGINTRKIDITDGMPGGSGMTSDAVIVALEDERNISSNSYE